MHDVRFEDHVVTVFYLLLFKSSNRIRKVYLLDSTKNFYVPCLRVLFGS